MFPSPIQGRAAKRAPHLRHIKGLREYVVGSQIECLRPKIIICLVGRDDHQRLTGKCADFDEQITPRVRWQVPFTYNETDRLARQEARRSGYCRSTIKRPRVLVKDVRKGLMIFYERR